MKYYKTLSKEIMAIDNGQEFLIQGGWVELTQSELQILLNPPLTAEQILAGKIAEATAYLKDTDWVETYKLRHDLKLELIPETSSKWEVLAKRGECKTFLRDNS